MILKSKGGTAEHERSGRAVSIGGYHNSAGNQGKLATASDKSEPAELPGRYTGGLHTYMRDVHKSDNGTYNEFIIQGGDV